jgi:head-tail adaptor
MARGDLRHALALENPGLPVPDGEGGFTEGWTPLDPPTMWASIEPAAATDLQRVVGDAQVIATASHLIELDYHPDITIKTRLTWTRPPRPDRWFQVQGVVNVEERDVRLILACVELVGATAPPERV